MAELFNTFIAYLFKSATKNLDSIIADTLISIILGTVFRSVIPWKRIKLLFLKPLRLVNAGINLIAQWIRIWRGRVLVRDYLQLIDTPKDKLMRWQKEELERLEKKLPPEIKVTARFRDSSEILTKINPEDILKLLFNNIGSK